MKHLKLFEDLPRVLPKNLPVVSPIEPEPEQYSFKIGDEVYCIRDIGVSNWIHVGGKYKITKIDMEWAPPQLHISLNGKDVTGDRGGLHWNRFTKNPNHPAIIEYIANKYNI